MKVHAVIFDLDGTVVSDEDEWGEAFRKVLKSLGVEVSLRYPHIGGIGIEENWPVFIKKYNIKTQRSHHELAVATKKEYEKLISKIKLKKGFKDFVKKLRGLGIKTALATSSTWDTVEKIFDRFNLQDYFDSVTTGEEVSYKKPDPQIFEIAAEKLGISPSRSIVIEDSEAGVKAARLAGMKVIAIYRSNKHKKTLQKANLLVKNFDQVYYRSMANL